MKANGQVSMSSSSSNRSSSNGANDGRNRKNRPSSAGSNKGNNNSGNCSNNQKKKDGKDDDEEELPQELQHLEKELVHKIQNEILDNGEAVTFDHIAGLEDAKQVISEVVCWPMKRPELFRGLRRASNGLLLYGPPGCVVLQLPLPLPLLLWIVKCTRCHLTTVTYPFPFDVLQDGKDIDRQGDCTRIRCDVLLHFIVVVDK